MYNWYDNSQCDSVGTFIYYFITIQTSTLADIKIVVKSSTCVEFDKNVTITGKKITAIHYDDYPCTD